MFYLDNIEDTDLDHYFQNFDRLEQYKWYARIQESIGHDSSEYDFRYTHDLRLWCMTCSGDRFLAVQHEDENYIIYRSHDTGVIADIFLNKKTGQWAAIEVFL